MQTNIPTLQQRQPSLQKTDPNKVNNIKSTISMIGHKNRQAQMELKKKKDNLEEPQNSQIKTPTDNNLNSNTGTAKINPPIHSFIINTNSRQPQNNMPSFQVNQSNFSKQGQETSQQTNPFYSNTQATGKKQTPKKYHFNQTLEQNPEPAQNNAVNFYQLIQPRNIQNTNTANFGNPQKNKLQCSYKEINSNPPLINNFTTNSDIGSKFGGGVNNFLHKPENTNFSSNINSNINCNFNTQSNFGSLSNLTVNTIKKPNQFLNNNINFPENNANKFNNSLNMTNFNNNINQYSQQYSQINQFVPPSTTIYKQPQLPQQLPNVMPLQQIPNQFFHQQQQLPQNILYHQPIIQAHQQQYLPSQEFQNYMQNMLPQHQFHNLPVFPYNNHENLPRQAPSLNMESMVSNFFIPCIQAITDIKRQIKQQKKQKQHQHQPQPQQKYITKQQYFRFPDQQKYEQLQFSNLRKKNKKNRQNKIIINIIKIPEHQKMRRFQQSRKFMKRLKNLERQSRFQMIQSQQRMPYQNRLQRRIDEQFRKKQEQLDRVYVSQFTQIRKLQYKADLRWVEEPSKIRNNFEIAIVQVSDKPSEKQIQQAIMLDLHRKGHTFRKNYIFQHKHFQLKTEKPNFIMKLLFGKRQRQIREFQVEVSILQQKIDVESQYEYSPKQFKGFIVKDLLIKNKYGSIQWKGFTDIQNISFFNKIKIRQNSVQCNVPKLQKQAFVEFYNLPGYKQGQNLHLTQKRLKKIAKGAQLHSFDVTKKTWTIIIDFSVRQSQAEDDENISNNPASIPSSFDFTEIDPSATAADTFYDI